MNRWKDLLDWLKNKHQEMWYRFDNNMLTGNVQLIGNILTTSACGMSYEMQHLVDSDSRGHIFV